MLLVLTCAANSMGTIDIVQRREDGEVDQGKSPPKGNLELNVALTDEIVRNLSVSELPTLSSARLMTKQPS